MNPIRPKVSIGMPVYNGENYIEIALDSIITQTFTDFELIISDNASTDRTQEICVDYAKRDPRIRYYRNDKNIGAAPNYNRLFALASGEYFKWAAHDDFCAPEMLARYVEILDCKPDVVICYSHTYIINGKGVITEHYSDGLDLQWDSPFKRFDKLLNTQSWCNPIFGLIRAEVLRSTPLIADFPRSDRVLLSDLALRGKFVELPEYLFYRRVHAGISTEVNVNERDLAAWFNPALKGKIIFPRLQRYARFVRTIRLAPIHWMDKLRCYGSLARLVVSRKRVVKGIAEDDTNASHQLAKINAKSDLAPEDTGK